MVAGLFDEIVQACALAAEDEATVGGDEVEAGVVGGAALVKAYDPDVGLLHLLKGANEVGDAGDADVFGGSGGGLGDGRRDGRRTALGEDDAVNAGPVGGAEESAEVVGVFDTVECEEEAALMERLSGEEVLDGEELAVAEEGDDTLVHVGLGEARKLFTGLEGDADAGRAGEGGELLELTVAALACDRDAVEPSGAGAKSLFHWMQAVENFHDL